MNLRITGGRLIDPGNKVDAQLDLFVSDGVVVGVGTAPPDFSAPRTIDAGGLVVLPGLVDLSARLHTPDRHDRAAFDTEIMAALAGGVTSLVLPSDDFPSLDEPRRVAELKQREKLSNAVHLYPLGAMTIGLKGDALTDMAALADAGCVAFSNADHAIRDHRLMMHAMRYARTFDYALWLRPDDYWLAQGGVAASGAYATRLGLSGVPEQAETVGLQTLIALQRVTGVRLHICRLSSAAGIEIVRAAKRDGLPITCDVSINHAHLTDIDIGFYDANARLQPPLRGQRDRDAIRRGLADGTIDAICSDHNPIDEGGKLHPFAEAEPGACGLELLLPLCLRLMRETRLPLLQTLALITSAPGAILAAAFHGPSAARVSHGRLSIGAPADFCLVDLQASWHVNRESLRSHSSCTPFSGMEMPGRVHATFIAGRKAWEHSS
jgi:dihydroorotase